MRAGGGKAEAHVALVILRKFAAKALFDLFAAFPPRLFGQDLQLFGAARQKGVLFGGEGGKAAHIVLPGEHDLGGVAAQLLVPHGEGIHDEGKVSLFEQLVALGKDAVVAHQRRVVGARQLREGNVQKAAALVRPVLDEAQLCGAEEHAVDIAQKVCVAGDLSAVDAHLAPGFKDVRLDGDGAEAGAGGGKDVGVLFPLADELPVLFGAERSARAQVEQRLGAVGLALRVFAVEHVQPRGESKGLVRIIPEVFECEGIDLHLYVRRRDFPQKSRRFSLSFFPIYIIMVGLDFVHGTGGAEGSAFGN